jgi:hypothetical protein
MAKRKTSRAVVSLPPLPRGLRTASPQNARKMLASINHCAAVLHYQRANLRRKLQSVRSQMPPELRRQYTKALADLHEAYTLVSGIPCSGPFMSFELPLLLGQQQPERRTRPRGR